MYLITDFRVYVYAHRLLAMLAGFHPGKRHQLNVNEIAAVKPVLVKYIK